MTYFSQVNINKNNTDHIYIWVTINRGSFGILDNNSYFSHHNIISVMCTNTNSLHEPGAMYK